MPGSAAAAVKAVDWLISVQTQKGGWPGWVVGVSAEPVTFNTGQILIGLAAALRAGHVLAREPAIRGGDWLLAMQDEDGAWRRGLTQFASPGPKAYETHTGWGLLVLSEATGQNRFAEAALRHADWALGQQRPNGWFDRCCLTDRLHPLTHTIGYTVRGLLEAWRVSGEVRFLEGAQRAGAMLARRVEGDGFLPGRLAADWSAAA